jgi:endonuclease-3
MSFALYISYVPRNISREISLVSDAVRNFQNPIVTEIGDQTGNPYKVLVSCLLSLRTRDETTARVSRELFRIADTPQKMMRLPLRRVEKTIYSVNYYKTKARRIKAISKTLVEKYGGKVPRKADELLDLKGVGRKTCNIVMNYGFNDGGYIAVDTHVHRIPNRLGWINTKKPEETEQALMRVVPRRQWRMLNDTFVTFGAEAQLQVLPAYKGVSC